MLDPESGARRHSRPAYVQPGRHDDRDAVPAARRPREADRLPELDGRYGAFADALKSLARGYQSKAILRLVEQHMDTTRAP